MNDEQSRGDSASGDDDGRGDGDDPSLAAPGQSADVPDTDAQIAPAIEPAASDGPAGDASAEDDVTESGYRYSVVDDDATQDGPGYSAPSTPERSRPSPLLIAAVAIVPAIIVGVLAWLAATALMGDSGGGGRAQSEQNVGNVINVFSQGQTGAVVNRYEGSLAPGFPDEIPNYPGSQVVASVVQILDGDANYLVVYDTADDRETVANWFVGALDEDPWQLDAGQSGETSTLHRFTRIDDPDVAGLLLIGESDSDERTTIVYSLEVTSGGEAASDSGDFDPGESKSLPEGFPDDIEPYPGGIITGTAFQSLPQAESFSLTIVTQDTITDVIEFYTNAFEDAGWTVETQDASQAPLVNAEGLSFASEADTISGAVFAGEHPRDDSYTQIELQVVVTE